MTIGTNAHQLTRKAIGKRQPALQGAVRRFNTLRLKLAELRKPEWNIPIPSELPTTISELRDHSDLMEDVWITPSTVAIPKWLEDEKARRGIRAMLKLDQCRDEVLRLGREADNMCHWYGQELRRVEVAISQPSSTSPCRLQLVAVLLTWLQARNSNLSWKPIARSYIFLAQDGHRRNMRRAYGTTLIFRSRRSWPSSLGVPPQNPVLLFHPHPCSL